MLEGESLITFIEIDQPAESHPESLIVSAEALYVANEQGKKISKIGWKPDSLFDIEFVLERLEHMMKPMPEKYKSLFIK